MNKLIKAFLTCTIIFLAGCNLFPEKSKKPVIYLYPENTTEVDVKVNLDDKNAEIEFSSDIDDKIISDLIKSAGYTITSIKNA